MIRDPKTFEALFGVLASECCQRLNYGTIANELDIRKETLRDYLFYFQYSFLVSESRFYSKSRRHQERKEKKIYISDVGLRNAVTGYLDSAITANGGQLGFICENVVADHVKRLKFHYEQGLQADLFYWYDQAKSEVDIVLEVFQKLIPIEVKYQNDISRSELKGTKSFMKKFNPPFGIIVTKKDLKIEENLLYVPLWLFLLLC
jgi:predicted AAA+ superfamily ATPase